MRLCRFDAGAGPRYGVIEDRYVVDRDDAEERHPLEGVRLLAPVLPRKFLAIGLNYADHIAESGMETPQFPVFFNKQITCAVGPDDDVHTPRVSNLLDYEGELAVVIGRRCRHVPVERALEVIAGYTITNDVSVRDWQLRTPTMTMGKSFDTHGPLGPWIVTADVRQPFPDGLLKIGDVVRIEIDGIGELRNTVVEEPDGFVVPESEEAPQWAH